MRFIESENLIPRRTSISNLFFNTFLKDATGDDVKVYLYAYYLCKESVAMTKEDFAKSLHMESETIERAINYWMNTGLIEMKDGDMIFHDPDSLTLKNIVTTAPQKTEDPEMKLIEANRNPEIREMFRQADYIVRRPLVPEEKKKFITWIETYHMSIEMILHALSYAYDDQGVKHLDYVEGILRRWYDAGYTSLDDVIDNTNLMSSTMEIVRKSLNFKQSQMTEPVKEMIEKWKTELGYSDDIISLACAQTVNIREPNVKYVDAVLRAWHDEGVTDLTGARAAIENRPQRPSGGGTSKLDDYYMTTERQTDEYSDDELKKLLGLRGGL